MANEPGSAIPEIGSQDAPAGPRHRTEEERLTAAAKALGEVCVYPWNEQGMPGIILRWLYAGMAMQGAMHALAIQADEFEDDEPVDPHPIARDAVRMADALLKELAK